CGRLVFQVAVNRSGQNVRTGANACVPSSRLYKGCADADPVSSSSMTTEKATFGAGCFWGVEETFRNLKGVTSTAVGYAGVTKENPTYEDVCMNETGHAEVVEVEFDPSQIAYDELLDVFWSNHNPTTLNRQGPDV